MKQPVIKECSMYLREGTIYIRTVSATIGGPCQVEGPVGQVADLRDLSLIGSAALRFAEQSREGIEYHMIEDINEAAKEWLEVAGVSSWRTFVRSAKSVSLGIYDETFVTPYVKLECGYNITPYARKGLGYLALTHIHLPPDSIHKEIGRAIMGAFDRCV